MISTVLWQISKKTANKQNKSGNPTLPILLSEVWGFCIRFMVVFFIVCTTIDREVRILERPLSRTIKNELRFFAFVRSFVPQAVPGQERMNARTEGFEVSLQLHRREQDINAHVSPTPFSTADVQVIDRLQMVAFSILAKLVCEALWG